LGLQYKNIDTVAAELEIQPNQVLALFNKALRKVVRHFLELEEVAEDKLLAKGDDNIDMQPTAITLEEDLAEIDQDTKKMLDEKQKNLISELALPEYAIQGDNKDWEAAALQLKRSKVPNIISVKRKTPDEKDDTGKQPPNKKKRRSSHKKSKKQ